MESIAGYIAGPVWDLLLPLADVGRAWENGIVLRAN